MKSAADNLKNELGIDIDKPIPASFNVPYYVHQDDMNRQEQSHKIESNWKNAIICGLIFVYVITIFGFLIYESNKPSTPVTVTQTTPSGNNSSYIGRDNMSVNTPEATE